MCVRITEHDLCPRFVSGQVALAISASVPVGGGGHPASCMTVQSVQ